jgi:CBS domain-containing protein
MSSEIKTILDNTRIKHLLPPYKELHFVERSESVLNVFKKLTESKVSGVFVLDGHDPIGWVDLYDVLVYVVFLLNEVSDGDVENVDFDETLVSGKFEKHTASDVRNLSLNDDWMVVSWDVNVFQVIQHMLAKRHRVAVCNYDGKVVNVLSQLDVMVFLTQCREIIDKLQVPIGSYPSLVGKEVITHPKDKSLLSALLTCYQNDVTGLAVTDKSGKIVGNLSAHDLIGITSKNLSLLSLSVDNFLAFEGKPIKPAITVKITDNLEIAFLKITAYRIHRVYIVDENQMPVGVVSLTDLLKLTLEQLIY